MNRATDVKLSKDNDTTYGLYMKDGQIMMGIKAIQLNGNNLMVDDTESRRVGGGGDYIYFSDTDVPVKTKGEPKAGAGFLINYQPKSGANHMF